MTQDWQHPRGNTLWQVIGTPVRNDNENHFHTGKTTTTTTTTTKSGGVVTHGDDDDNDDDAPKSH